jgi:MoxR-like ATPase
LNYNGCAEAADLIVENVEHVISGKHTEITRAVAALLAGGHVLIEDIPGVGKTLLAKSIASSLGASFGRIQFTPDLLPADVTGLNVYNQAESHFEFRPGPIFANVVLADEINRASPKTQSALLEAMGEWAVTVDGCTRRLSLPFGVIATQNPIEHEGTYPLPHAELDRFMVRMSLGYPGEEAEMELLRLSSDPLSELGPVVSLEEFLEMRRLVTEVHASEALLSYVVSITAATREHEGLHLGASPRAGQMLLESAKAMAALQGRPYCLPDDVKAVAPYVLSHRLIPATRTSPSANGKGQATEEAIHEILASVPVGEAV